MAGLALAPLMLMCTTSFLKVSIVLAIVRNAIGIQQVPPGMAIYALALAVTAFVMAPVFQESAQRLRLNSGSLQQQVAEIALEDLDRAAQPFRDFMVRHTSPEKRRAFREIAVSQWPRAVAEKISDTDFAILIPAFVVSELQIAFEVGFLIYVPFVVIDLLVSNLLLALGMQMVSPATVSLPLKMLLFVLIDGWGKLVEGLVRSYGGP